MNHLHEIESRITRLNNFPTKRSATELGKKMALSQDLRVSPEFHWIFSCVSNDFNQQYMEINEFLTVLLNELD